MARSSPAQPPTSGTEPPTTLYAPRTTSCWSPPRPSLSSSSTWCSLAGSLSAHAAAVAPAWRRSAEAPRATLVVTEKPLPPSAVTTTLASARTVCRDLACCGAPDQGCGGCNLADAAEHRLQIVGRRSEDHQQLGVGASQRRCGGFNSSLTRFLGAGCADADPTMADGGCGVGVCEGGADYSHAANTSYRRDPGTGVERLIRAGAAV
jgi:hypothetical protein